MIGIRLTAVIAACLSLTACGIGSVCEKPQRYEASRPGKRVEAPEGLDALQPGRELAIPDASPRPPRADDAPCLELPPGFRSEEE